ncbi:7-carboxy-7-deazaguanine synthase QueE [Catenovulum sp. SM1970]|uniref:7-carboxy-7-deazaguanine synthase QueE n=1 Tax=Marinifaba aquimaris TaxID=2741323 RepID=UPI001571F4F3|nr:7-carboxy-7-deazaguanine synthase QueE [Marinifaba aquimaris]NTS76081.1 7-carboxy-7-deazaguanine synthase QueE [Marinifaba aquimaris]
MTAVSYPVNEIFETIQGEGQFTGVPSLFVRLQVCPVGCSWCDTQHTWYKNDEQKIDITDLTTKTEDSPTWAEMTSFEILDFFKKQGYTAKHVVITGGEPCMYDLVPFTKLLEANGYQCQIETSGTFEVKTSTDTFVTVSPKVGMKGGYDVLQSALLRANEIKHPIAKQSHIDELDTLLADLPASYQAKVCLQPISQKPRATELAIETCIKRNWRLSIQTHKYLDIS